MTKRPKNIEKRDRAGHWEGDLIELRGSKKKTINILVERKKRMVSKEVKTPALLLLHQLIF
jgi:IS30 family transposase